MIVSVHDGLDDHGMADTSIDASIPVTIAVTDIDEPPLVGGARAVGVDEGTAGPLASYSAADPEGENVTLTLGGLDEALFGLADGTLSFLEAPNFEASRSQGVQNVYLVDIVASDGTNEVTRSVQVAVRNVDEAPEFTAGVEVYTIDEDSLPTFDIYNVTDPERAANIEWRVSGPDAAVLSINASDRLILVEGVDLDFEAPIDHNRDNVYEAIVEAYDGLNTAQRPVTITVDNVDEPGVITANTLFPQAGVQISLQLSDPDGGISGLSWAWSLDSAVIPGATSQTYTPVVADVNKPLAVTAAYTDAHGSAKTASLPFISAVQAVPGSNAPPECADETGLRMVAENLQPRSGIGDLIDCTDGDGSDVVTFSLSGTHSHLVALSSIGQLETRVRLDHETTPTLSVTVTIVDASLLSATLPVTITVTDVAEPPTVTGSPRVTWPESRTGDVAAYEWHDPARRAAQWSLSGDDAAQFEITGGVLRFVAPRDYESPEDQGADNVYDVTVEATADTDTVTRNITVTVVNEDEPGTVTLSKSQPDVGDSVTATVADPDGDVPQYSVFREWQRSADRTTWTPIVGVNNDPNRDVDTYVVTEHDRGAYLRAVAWYDDPHGVAKSAAASVPRPIGLAAATTRRPVGPSRSFTGGGGGGGGATEEPEDRASPVLVVANGWSPADIGVAAALSASTPESAVAYTAAGELSPETLDLLRAHRIGDVVIVGGAAAVSDAVADRIDRARAGLDVERIAGGTRAETAALAARRILDGTPSRKATLVVANGWSPADIGVAAAAVGTDG